MAECPSSSNRKKKEAFGLSPGGEKVSHEAIKKGLKVHLTLSELGMVAIVAIIVLALSSVPYLVGWLSQTNEMRFSGLLFNLEDSNVYLAAMQQGLAGAGRFCLLFTPEPEPGMFLYMFYVGLGWLARWTGWSVMMTYHVARIVAALGLSLTIYTFISAFLPRAMRLTAFVLCTLASGLGWAVILITPPSPGGISPIDFWLMDGFTFFTELLTIHFSVAITLLLIFFLSWRQHLLTFSALAWLLAWLCLSGLFIIHPKIVPLAASVTGMHLLLLGWRRGRLPRREMRSLILLGLAASPWVGAYLMGQIDNPVLAELIRQDITMSPPPVYYVLGYGLLWPLALLGMRHMWRQRESSGLLLIAWPIGALIVAYFPMQIQRRMVTGLLIPLGVLATSGLFTSVLPAVRCSRWAGWLQSRLGYPRCRTRLLVLNFLVALTLPSTLYLLLSFSLAAATQDPRLFLSRDEVEAINWLQQNSNGEDVILSSYPTGNRLPALTGRRVVWGHWNLTLSYENKRREVERFFDSRTPDSERSKFLREYRVSFLYFGPYERALGDFDPTQANYLACVFSQQDVRVYRVITSRINAVE